MTIKTFAEYEAAAAETAIYPNRGDNPTYPIVAIGGEAGEILNTFKKNLRGDDGEPGRLTDERRDKILKECGGVLWYIAAIAHELGSSMEEIATANVQSLASRAKRGTIKGTGDDR